MKQSTKSKSPPQYIDLTAPTEGGPLLTALVDVDPLADANAPRKIACARTLDLLFPSRELSIWGGPSGGGKSTLLLQTLAAYQSGGLVFGHEVDPCECAYITGDRSRKSYERTFDRLGMRFEDIGRFVSLVDDTNYDPEFDGSYYLEGGGRAPTALERAIEELPDDVRILGIDPLLAHVPGDANKYKAVASFVLRLTRLAQKRNLTIFGVLHTTKQKKGAEIMSVLERLYGSVAWAGFVETVVIFESVDKTLEKNCDRRVIIKPRNAPSETLRYRFDDAGRLGLVQDARAVLTFSDWLEGKRPGDRFRRNSFHEWARAMGLATRTTDLRLSEWTDGKLLRHVGRGLYERTSVSLQKVPIL